MKNRIRILNVEIDNISQEELLAQLKRGVLVTPNVDDIMKHQRDEEFHRYASQADYVVCDSKIVLLSSGFLGTPLREAIPGSSFSLLFVTPIGMIIRGYSCLELKKAWEKKPKEELIRE